MRIVSDCDHPLGVGYLNPATLIAARILARDCESPLGRGWIASRLRQALAFRDSIYSSPYYRWVFGGADSLPGLVLDRFGDLVVGQIATLGMERLRGAVESAICEVLLAYDTGLEERLRRTQARGLARGRRCRLGFDPQ